MALAELKEGNELWIMPKYVTSSTSGCSNGYVLFSKKNLGKRFKIKILKVEKLK